MTKNNNNAGNVSSYQTLFVRGHVTATSTIYNKDNEVANISHNTNALNCHSYYFIHRCCARKNTLGRQCRMMLNVHHLFHAVQ